MSTVTTADGTTLHVVDEGRGRPVVLSHGWPLSGEAFAGNVAALVDAGCRVIRYDRRGFGQSDKPAGGYDYDTLADDLDAVMTTLDLRDAVLLGFSMGGGDVVRYLARHGSGRVAGLVLSGSVTPMLAVTEDNPDGAMPQDAFDEMADQCASDPENFLDEFVTNFFSNEAGLQVSAEQRDAARRVAGEADVAAAAACIRIWGTDLREDCRGIDVPTLVLHGSGDQNVPLETSSRRTADLVAGARLEVVEGGTHGLNLSHQQEWERAVVTFVTSLPTS